MGPLWLFGSGHPGRRSRARRRRGGRAPAARRASARRSMAAAILLACLAWTLVRTEGVSGDHVASFGWRLAPSAEERLLAQAAREPVPSATPLRLLLRLRRRRLRLPLPQRRPRGSPAAAPGQRAAAVAPAAAPPVAVPADDKPAAWPGFRGPDRDSVVHGVQLETDWTAAPPVQIWRRAIGPGWSSFAVQGDVLHTGAARRGRDRRSLQGDHGRAGMAASRCGPVLGVEWRPRSAWDADARDGRVYAFGATGILNVLDARTGAAVVAQRCADRREQSSGLGICELTIGGRR